jgi:hypothetical protein
MIGARVVGDTRCSSTHVEIEATACKFKLEIASEIEHHFIVSPETLFIGIHLTNGRGLISLKYCNI